MEFDEIITPREATRVAQNRPQKSDRLIKDLRRVHYVVAKRTAALLEISREFSRSESTPRHVMNQLREKTGAHRAEIPSWIAPGASRPSSKVIESGGRMVASLSFDKGASSHAALQPIVDFGLRLGFSMDTGVPYPTSASVKTLLVDEVPRPAHDPLKPLRCATFAGWLTVAVSSLSAYQAAVEQAQIQLDRIQRDL
jgi:hypothetical protein